jgi:hypothetical protein
MISVFQEEMNFGRTKVTKLVSVAGTSTSADFTGDGSLSVPKMSRKRRIRIKKGVRLSSKYIAARR